jgi:hypothetical protein
MRSPVMRSRAFFLSFSDAFSAGAVAGGTAGSRARSSVASSSAASVALFLLRLRSRRYSPAMIQLYQERMEC